MERARRETAVTLPGQYYDSETGLHYNYFRYYDPSTGRYITSDPIGLDGGLNTYGYAMSNPVINPDQYGLVVWNVRDSFSASAVAGIGGAINTFVLESPCIDGAKTAITVVASGPSAGGGVSCKFCFTAPGKIPFQGSFEDGSPTPNPNAFNGGFVSVSANFQLLGFGGEFGDTVLGSARSIGRFTPALGFGTFGAELSGTIGTSTVIESKTEPCGCEATK